MTDVFEQGSRVYLNPYDDDGMFNMRIATRRIKMLDGTEIPTPEGTVAVSNFSDLEMVCSDMFARAEDIATEILNICKGNNPTLVIPLNGGFLPTMMVYRELVSLRPTIRPHIALFVHEDRSYHYLPEGSQDIFVIDDIIDGGGLGEKIESAKPSGVTVHLHAFTVKDTGNNDHIVGIKIPNAWGMSCAGMNSGWMTVEKSEDPDFSNKPAMLNALERSASILLVPDSIQSQDNRTAITPDDSEYFAFLTQVSIFNTLTWKGRMGGVSLINYMSVIEGLNKYPIESIMRFVTDAVSSIRKVAVELKKEF